MAVLPAEAVLKIFRQEQETVAARKRAGLEKSDYNQIGASSEMQDMKVNLAVSRWGLLVSRQETLAAKAETTAAKIEEDEEEAVSGIVGQNSP